MRVFHPNAPSAITATLASQHSKHDHSKRCLYKKRVCEVNCAGFVPLVFFSTAGGMGPACTTTFKRLASMLSGKFDSEYATMLNLLRCRTSFVLLRSSIMTVRGSRRHLLTPPVQSTLALVESRLSAQTTTVLHLHFPTTSVSFYRIFCHLCDMYFTVLHGHCFLFHQPVVSGAGCSFLSFPYVSL